MADNETKTTGATMSPKGFFDQSNKTATTNFVDKLASGDNKGAGEEFKDALRNKVGDALDASRKQYASGLFNAAKDVMTKTLTPGQGDVAEPHSDPKPNVAAPLTQNATQADVQNAMTPEAVPVNAPAETAPAETVPAETAPAESGETQTGE
jgi:hypothetical protein